MTWRIACRHRAVAGFCCTRSHEQGSRQSGGPGHCTQARPLSSAPDSHRLHQPAGDPHQLLELAPLAGLSLRWQSCYVCGSGGPRHGARASWNTSRRLQGTSAASAQVPSRIINHPVASDTPVTTCLTVTVCILACKQAAALEACLHGCCMTSLALRRKCSDASTEGRQQRPCQQPACFMGEILQRLFPQQAARRRLFGLCWTSSCACLPRPWCATYLCSTS